METTIEAVAHMERAAHDARSWIDRFAAAISRLAGSASSILVHLVWFLVWLAINLNIIPGIEPFDPFPFSLLTMVVSLEAIFLSLFVLISQNRMSKEADRRAELDLQVNLLAEKETTMILQMLKQISEKLGMSPQGQGDLQDLIKETKVEELSEKLDRALPPE